MAFIVPPLRAFIATTPSPTAWFRYQWLTAAIAGCSIIAGCGPTSETPMADGQQTEATDHEEDHDHSGHDHGDHDHSGHNHAEMGIHGGHVVVLEPGHVHAEWVHDDANNVLEVYVLDKPESVTAVRVVTTVKDQEPVTTELAKDDSLGTNGYSVTNPNVLTNIQMADGEAIKVLLQVETADGVLSAALSDDHGHDH